jgi:hypothetical protein
MSAAPSVRTTCARSSPNAHAPKMRLTGSTVPNMEKHTEHADRLEREADHLAEHSDALGDDIAETRENWEQRQTDDSVPGAVGEPRSATELPPPEPDETD